MKFILSIILAISAFSAQADSTVSLSPANDDAFWQELHNYALRCAVRPYTIRNNKIVYSHLASICPEFVVHGSTARFTMNGVSYEASLSDSRASDGNDLGYLVVYSNDTGFRTERDFVLCFGDIVLAMAGGDDQCAGQSVDTHGLYQPASFNREPKGEHYHQRHQENPQTPEEYRVGKSFPPGKGSNEHELRGEQQNQGQGKNMRGFHSSSTCGLFWNRSQETDRPQRSWLS